MASGFRKVFRLATTLSISGMRRQRRHVLTAHEARPSPVVVSLTVRVPSVASWQRGSTPKGVPGGNFFPPIRSVRLRPALSLRSPIVESHRLGRTLIAVLSGELDRFSKEFACQALARLLPPATGDLWCAVQTNCQEFLVSIPGCPFGQARCNFRIRYKPWLRQGSKTAPN